MAASDKQVGGDHYKKGGALQHWEMMYLLTGLGYHMGCATKYLTRWRDKNGLQDLEKSRHYAEFILEKIREDGATNPVPDDRATSTLLSQFCNSNKLPSAESVGCDLLMRWRHAEQVEQAIMMIDALIEVAKKEKTSARPTT